MQPVRLCICPRRDPSVSAGGGRRFGRAGVETEACEGIKSTSSISRFARSTVAGCCSNCVDVCPTYPGEALVMESAGGADAPTEELELHYENIGYKRVVDKNQVGPELFKFAQPLFPSSGRLPPNCSETLPHQGEAISQLFGDR